MRSDRAMNRIMRRDGRRMSDGRNPYGARGGYVRDHNMSDGRNPYGSRGGYVRDRMGDGRNPYGSAGGYVRDRRGMDYASDYNSDYNGEYDYRRDYAEDMRHDYARNDYNSERVGEYSGRYGNTPFRMRKRETFDYGDYNSDYGDYAEEEGSEKLGKDEISEWVEKLMHQLDHEEKEVFKMDKVIKKAKDMGEKFDKYSEEELFVTTLMIYSDYKNRIGKNNIDFSIGLAKDFLCDKDASVKYGEKLATYYDDIVSGE